MVTDVKTVGKNSSLIKAVRLMNRFKIGSIIVSEKGRPIGMVTEGDILRKIVVPGVNPKSVKVSEVMSTPVYSVADDGSIEDAAKLMTEMSVKRLAVVKDDRFVGIITTTDIIRGAPMLIGLLQEFIRARYVPHEFRSKP